MMGLSSDIPKTPMVKIFDSISVGRRRMGDCSLTAVSSFVSRSARSLAKDAIFKSIVAMVSRRYAIDMKAGERGT